MQRALSAAGKLFLAGEYAVLWGGTARIACVGPRSSAWVRRRDDTRVRILLEEGVLWGTVSPLGISWQSPPPPAFSFVARTADLAVRAHGKSSLGFDLALSPSQRALTGEKLGLGSSARAVVLAAEACRFVLEDRYDALKLALCAHAVAQGGKGSGGDVAASFAGGVVRYRRYPVEEIRSAGDPGPFFASLTSSPPVDLWRLPTCRFPMTFAFTGKGASTSGLVRQVEQGQDESARATFVQRSDALGQQLEDGLLLGDFTGVKMATSELSKLLASLGPVETEATQQMLALGATFGAAGKVSGAGGGDGCIFFSEDAVAQAVLLEGLKARGILGFPVELEVGLRGEPEVDPQLLNWSSAP